MEPKGKFSAGERSFGEIKEDNNNIVTCDKPIQLLEIGKEAKCKTHILNDEPFNPFFSLSHSNALRNITNLFRFATLTRNKRNFNSKWRFGNGLE